MRIYKIASKRFQYIGQCDVLRRTLEGKHNWNNMIENKEIVTIDEFKDMCNYEVLLEDDETLEEVIADGPDSYFAKSTWGNRDCYYLMTKGFEFIFVEK